MKMLRYLQTPYCGYDVHSFDRRCSHLLIHIFRELGARLSKIINHIRIHSLICCQSFWKNIKFHSYTRNLPTPTDSGEMLRSYHFALVASRLEMAYNFKSYGCRYAFVVH